MINFFIFLVSSLFNMDEANPLKNTSWFLNDKNMNEVRIYSDNFFSSTKYDKDNKKFLSTYGGTYLLDEEGYYEIIEFNSNDSSLVGDTIYISRISINLNNDNGLMQLDGKKYEKFKNYNSILSGSWLMSGIERGGEIRMRDVNRSRKTMKILAGGRFQWIAYDINKKGFYGTGGGIFTSENGNYIENIEFFSRDNSKVGISLEFNFEVKEGDWHHKGFSSKGDPKYEIWTQRKQ
ncbi:MAG: membrane or secreted protein [Bacteroidota bacterium]|nr:membrane or secreted protein [Bacteroidota bacterium]